MRLNLRTGFSEVAAKIVKLALAGFVFLFFLASQVHAQDLKTKPAAKEVNRDVIFAFINAPGIAPDFYVIALQKANNIWRASLKNRKNEVVREMEVTPGVWKGEDIGLIGGIMDNEIHFSLAGRVIDDKTKVLNIKIGF